MGSKVSSSPVSGGRQFVRRSDLHLSGRWFGGEFRGTPHYAIKYTLTVADGRVAEGSEIWMNFLFLSGKVRAPSKTTFPSTEWFDHRPIPEIDGENSSDPKLLGL